MIIRDAIQGDIELTKMEEKVVRTREMQRLHWIRQLGTTYQVYPCAVHTRFDHSLGVCCVAKQIIELIGTRHPNEFNKDEQEIVALMALVHDIAHLPFGHTLETELTLISDHDKGNRIEDFLTTGQIGKVLGSAAGIIANLLKNEPNKINKPFLVEIVKDTVCADLIDYIERDVYFTGLKRSYDKRFMAYFNLAPYLGKTHLVINITEEGAWCQDIAIELEHLLRVRYTLGERVYNYHTKIAADAMIGKAISEARLNESFFYDKGDERLVSYLATEANGSEIAKKIGAAFAERRLLRRCYMLDTKSFGGNNHPFVSQFHSPGKVRELCRETEDKLLRLCNKAGIKIDHSELIIFCHEPGMNLKAANLLVQEEGQPPRNLAETVDAIGKIQNDHRELWRFYVFTRRDVVEKVGTICAKYFEKESRCKPVASSDFGR